MNPTNKALLSTIVTLALPASARSADWDSLVTAVAKVESGMNHGKIGDRKTGRPARGAWQMTEAAWNDVGRLRKADGRMILPWSLGAHSPGIAREYASDFLAITSGRLAEGMGRPPTVQEIYTGFNIGATGFRRRGYRLDRCSRRTRDAAERVFTLCHAQKP